MYNQLDELLNTLREATLNWKEDFYNNNFDCLDKYETDKCKRAYIAGAMNLLRIAQDFIDNIKKGTNYE